MQTGRSYEHWIQAKVIYSLHEMVSGRLSGEGWNIRDTARQTLTTQVTMPTYMLVLQTAETAGCNLSVERDMDILSRWI